jgi:hypothetical protein
MVSEKIKKLVKVGISILIALIITILFVIIGSKYFTGYGVYIIIYGTPLVFIGTILLCLLFFVFKSTGNLRWFFGIFSFFIIIAIYNSGFLDIDLIIKNKLNNSDTPQEYEIYQDMTKTVLNFGNKEMKLFLESNEQIEHYFTKQNNLIVIKTENFDKEEGVECTKELLKLDINGNVIDKFSLDSKILNKQETFFEGYLINTNENYYRTWAIDGNTEKKKLEVKNENFSWELETNTNFIKNINQNANYFFHEYCYGEKKFDKIIYLIDNKWSVFYFDEKTKIDTFDENFIISKGKTENNLFKHFSNEKNKYVPNENSNIESVFFQKTRAKMSYSSGGSDDVVWEGNLYSHLKVGKVELKFKEELELDEKFKLSNLKINNKLIGSLTRKGQPFEPYFYWENKKINFQMFTNNQKKLYLIKNKH